VAKTAFAFDLFVFIRFYVAPLRRRVRLLFWFVGIDFYFSTGLSFANFAASRDQVPFFV
jgi:hypothetical protein